MIDNRQPVKDSDRLRIEVASARLGVSVEFAERLVRRYRLPVYQHAHIVFIAPGILYGALRRNREEALG